MIKYVDTNFVIILIRQIDAIRDYFFTTPPSPDLNSLVMFDVNGLYTLKAICQCSNCYRQLVVLLQSSFNQKKKKEKRILFCSTLFYKIVGLKNR